MINKDDLTFFYRQNLEENIIKHITKSKKIDLRKSVDLYYKSELSKQIETGQDGIDNLDYKNLVDNIFQTEIK